MMIKKITSVLLSAAIAGGVLLFSPFQAIGAETGEPVSLNPIDGVSTVLKYENGDRQTRRGLLQTAESEQSDALKNVAAYEIVVNGTSAVRVEPRETNSVGQEPGSGFYAVSFAIPGTSKEGFLTGLPAERIDAIQEKVVSGILNEAQTGDKNFEVEDAGIIDAEKVMKHDYDYNLCWAGSDSNMLHYTGWGKKAGFQTEDDLFDLYAENFNDKGYFEQNGIEWFFNGTLGSDHPDRTLPKNYGSSGGYLPGYPAESFVSTEYFDTKKNIAEALGRMTGSLYSGNAVGLGIVTSPTAAHAVTLWGYITDKSIPETEAAHYTDLIFSDNEDHFTSGDDRRLAPNTLCINNLFESVDEYGRFGKKGETVYMMVNGALHNYTSLKPYADDIPQETDPAATKDKVHDPDFAAVGAALSSYRYAQTTNTSLVKSGEVYFAVNTVNYSDVDWYDRFDVRVTVRRGNNETVAVSDNHFSTSRNISYVKRTVWLDPITLPAGEYTAEVTLNPDKSVREAYYLNNTYRFDFTVTDAPYDESAMLVTAASASKPTDKQETVSLSYGDIDPAFLSGVTNVTCYVSQYSDGSWGTDETTYLVNTYDGGVLPKTIQFLKSSAQKYRCKLRMTSGGIQYEIYANELPNRYAKLNVQTEPEGATLSPVDYGAVSLSEGEEIGVTVGYQTENYDQAFSGTCSVEAVYADGSTATLVQPQALALKSGETSGKICVKSWDTPLTNSVSLRFVITSQIDGADYRSETDLGELHVTERAGSVVDTAEDTSDPYDGKISLREAVAYSSVAGTPVTFAEGIKNVSVGKTILIDGKTEICHNDPINRVLIKGSGSFRVLENGSLTLRSLCFEPLQDAEVEHGCAVFVQGGSVYADNCRFTGCNSTVSGGAVYAAGGTVRVRNSQFYMCAAPKAAAVYLADNAKADMLNTTFFMSMRSATVLENHGSRLNLVNSAVTNNQLVTDERCAMVSDGETNVINSIIMSNSAENDVSGTARYFAVAYNTACDGVTYDRYCRSYQPEELFCLNYLGWPAYDDLSFGVAPRLKEPAAQGCLVAAKDGTLRLSSDGMTYTDTGVAAVWTAEELSADCAGNKRGSIFGAYAKLFVPYRLGDVNGDGTVNISDATLLRRYLAGYQVTDPERVKLCGKILHHGAFDGEITINDATEIQRYLAEFETASPIGKEIESH